MDTRTRGDGEGGVSWERRTAVYTGPSTKQRARGGLRQSSWSSGQCDDLRGGRQAREGGAVCMHAADSLRVR